jgi:hypothetical protein
VHPEKCPHGTEVSLMRWNLFDVLGIGTMLIACLSGISQGAEGPVTVETENFLVTAPSVELAKDVLLQAEIRRLEIAKIWLGEKLPPSVGRTFIRVKLSDVEDKALSLIADNKERLTHCIWLTTNDAGISGALAHEMAHVVLATQYPGELPPWGHEGIAGGYDGPQRRAARSEVLAWFAKTGNWPPLERVLASDFIARRDVADHTAAVSLVEFLLERGDRSLLLEFARAGSTTGWDAALQRYYQIQGVAGLQPLWEAWAAGHSNRLAMSADNTALPKIE